MLSIISTLLVQTSLNIRLQQQHCRVNTVVLLYTITRLHEGIKLHNGLRMHVNRVIVLLVLSLCTVSQFPPQEINYIGCKLHCSLPIHYSLTTFPLHSLLQLALLLWLPCWVQASLYWTVCRWSSPTVCNGSWVQFLLDHNLIDNVSNLYVRINIIILE